MLQDEEAATQGFCWRRFTRRYKYKVRLVLLVAMTLALTAGTYNLHTTVASRDPPGEPQPRQPFIPNSLKEAPVGRPANIPTTFFIEEADLCQRLEGVQVVAYVHSAISRVEERRQTRQTWARTWQLEGAPNITVVFMVGRAKNRLERDTVQAESDKYHDIVQGDYEDAYELLSYKALAALYWVSRHCAHVPWTLHADDDILLDPFVLDRMLQNVDVHTKEQMHCRALHEVVKRKGRWKVTRAMFARKRYPEYCQGTVWFLATKHVHKMLQASRTTNYLWVDDAYITGLLIEHNNITIHDIDGTITHTHFSDTDIGKNVAWFHLEQKDRNPLWSRLLAYHGAVENTV